MGGFEKITDTRQGSRLVVTHACTSIVLSEQTQKTCCVSTVIQTLLPSESLTSDGRGVDHWLSDQLSTLGLLEFREDPRPDWAIVANLLNYPFADSIAVSG